MIQQPKEQTYVSFVCQNDADTMFKNKSKLKKGIYIDRQYIYDTDCERKLLRVIMCAAKNIRIMKENAEWKGTPFG